METSQPKTKPRARFSPFFIAFLALAVVFLALGMGTLGSFENTGTSYELAASTENNDMFVVFRLESSHKELVKGEDGKETVKSYTVRLVDVLVNVVSVYAEENEATLSIERSTRLDNDSPFTTRREGTISNADALGWVSPFEIPANWSITTYPYYRIKTTANVRIGEIIFVGEITEEGEREGDRVAVNCSIANVPPISDEKPAAAKERANALIDTQFAPEKEEKTEDEAQTNSSSTSAATPEVPFTRELPKDIHSSFYSFGEEERPFVQSIEEMRADRSLAHADGSAMNVYRGDTVYGALGLDFLALGTAMFGLSPFGLRFFPMLASFGVLVVGYFFTKRLTKSDAAAFAFAALYALCNLSFSLGRMGTPLSIGIFFFAAALALCHRFYAAGMKKTGFVSALPILGAGLFCAAAICVHGAFVIPVAGVCGLFACAVVRQWKARRFFLDAALGSDAPEEEKEERAKEVALEYRNKNVSALVAFPAAFLLGALILSLLAMLPAHQVFVNLYDNAVSSVHNVFEYAWMSFAGGFSSPVRSAWTWFYPIFSGSGDIYAVTGAVMNPAAAAVGLFGIVVAVWRIALCIRAIVKKSFGKAERIALRRTLVPLGGMVLSLITAAFAPAGVGFVFLAYIFSFALSAEGMAFLLEGNNVERKGMTIGAWVALGLLVAMFALFFVFTFSVPLSAELLAKFF